MSLSALEAPPHLDASVNAPVRELEEPVPRELLAALNVSNICIRTFDGTIRYWSEGNERLYGWSRDEAIGEVLDILLRAEFPAPLYQIERELLKSGTWKGELSHRTKAGSKIRVASHWVLQRNADGSARSVIEINNDITDCRLAEETSRHLRSLVEFSDDAIIGENLKGLVTSWNLGAGRLFGYTEAEMSGQSILKLFPPELVPEEDSIRSRISQGERVPYYDTVRVNKSGQRISVSLAVSPIRDEHGRVVGASKIARDISSTRALEQAIQASEQRYRLAIEAGEIGVWSYNADSRESHWSDRCKTMFCLPQHEPVPSYDKALQYIHPDDVEQAHNAFQSSIERGTVLDVDFRIIDAEGKLHWLRSKGRPVVNSEGRVVEIHGAVVDFTDAKRIEEDLTRTNRHLQHFAYAAAHDLQEPLRNVALSIQLAKTQIENQVDPAAAALLDGAIENAHQLEAMVRDLLAYSKVLHEMDECPREVVDANEVLEAALKNLAAVIGETSAQITFDKLPPVRMARIHLLQLFQNLVGNALKHRGSDAPQIHVGARLCHGYCQFSIVDNGLGIEPQFQQRVFDVFKRLRKKDIPGTGIGLALCKRIVEGYSGRIWISSDGQKGTTVFFMVPTPEVS